MKQMANRVTQAIRNILNRKHSYRRTFLDADGKLGRDAEIVLADLRRFCRVTASTAVVSPVSKTIDPIAMGMAEGRREVWNRIMAHLYVDEKQVFNLDDGNDKD
jgi:hypothetical protein